MKAKPKISSSRWRLYGLGAVGATLLSLGLWHLGFRWGQVVDNAAHDAGFNMRPALSVARVAEELPRSRDIVIVDLPHEIPRPLLAKLIKTLRLAKGVALDLMLVDHASQLSKDEIPLFRANGDLKKWEQEDKELAKAIKEAKNVVIGSWPDMSPSGTVRWTDPARAFGNNARARVHLKVVPDQEDGFVRRVRLWEDRPAPQTAPGVAVPALSLQMAALARGEKPEQLVPPGGEREMWVNYLGPRTIFSGQRVVFALVGEWWEPEDFKNKLVFVGQTDFRSKDISDTPYGEMPGLFVHANATATLLDQGGLPQNLPFWAVALLTLASALLIVVPLVRRTFLLCALVGFLEIGGLWLLVAWLWAKHSIAAPFSVPALAVILTYNFVALYEYTRARRTLGNVVGRTMLGRLLEARDEPSLGGKEEVATAFFCDLRGFSEWAQTRTPQQLIADLNAYTTNIVHTVESFGGRPIDFFGDGVFVLFEGHNHAKRGIEAALAVTQALEQEQQPHLRAGVALHTGTMVIGLVGHAQHYKPGAVGEAVNIASRVQSLSSECGFPVLITRGTLEASGIEEAPDDSRSPLQAVPCGEYQLKGYSEKFEIFGFEPISTQVLRN